MYRELDQDPPRPTSIRQMVYQVTAQVAQPMAPGDVAARLPIEQASIYKAMQSLRRDGFLRYIAGSRRLHELVPGKPMPPDNRGKARGSRAAILRIAKLRRLNSAQVKRRIVRIPAGKRG
jgi:hypothetical protein